MSAARSAASIAALTVYVVLSLVNSTYGRGFLAVRDDEIAAEAMGINTTKYKVMAFVLGAFFAGIAGGLYAHRFRTGHGFANPSVFCPDLRVLIDRTNEERSEHATPAEPAPAEVIARLAAGFGDEATIGWLAEQQRSVSRALVAATMEQHGGGEALAELEAEHPQAVRRVLAHPYVRAWAVGMLRTDDPAGMPYLGGLAAAAAVHAGARVETEVRIDRRFLVNGLFYGVDGMRL